MIDVYFLLDGKKPGECVGGVSLKETHPTMEIDVWTTYKVYPITEKTVLFTKNGDEFCTVNGTYEHEMGTITVNHITGLEGDVWLNVNVKERC